jgi:predicted GNAT family acetyltransferase
VEPSTRRVRRTGDAAAFLDATRALRAADPVRTNVLGSVATGVDGGTTYADASFFVVENAPGAVVGAALWTPPYKLLLSPMDDEAAAVVAAAAALRSKETGHRLPGVIGPEPEAHVAATSLGRPFHRSMDERLLVLHDFLPSRGVPGSARAAVESDVALVQRWLRDFADEASVLMLDSEDAVRERLPRTWLWDVEGVPVSLAGHAPVVTTPSGDVARVGPVYTPAEHRKHGYASAITSAVVEVLRPVVDVVMLFTDSSNPTSNHVYEALGFVHEGDIVELTFDDV